eukprot:10568518-Alexandrium_andersonii.AAC.1
MQQNALLQAKLVENENKHKADNEKIANDIASLQGQVKSLQLALSGQGKRAELLGEQSRRPLAVKSPPSSAT